MRVIGRAPSGLSTAGLAVIVIAVTSVGLLGCEKVSHDNLDKWMTTENGVAKLKGALRDPDNDKDLRAHAAHNLIVHQQAHIVAVKDALDGMDPRMGLCIDIGHTVRTGTDVVKAVVDFVHERSSRG